jgi:hypothetical protein
MKYNATEKIVKKAANYFATLAALELSAKRPKLGIRATWKKVGKQWEPAGPPKRITIRGNSVASGNLLRSLRGWSQGLEFGVEMDWYGQAVINGRQPEGKYRGGKGIPSDKLSSWAKMKNIKPRNIKTGQFIKNNDSNRKGMVFAMNRKIKHFGIEPFDFIKMPRRATLAKYRDEIAAAVKKDIQNNLRNEL